MRSMCFGALCAPNYGDAQKCLEKFSCLDTISGNLEHIFKKKIVVNSVKNIH